MPHVPHHRRIFITDGKRSYRIFDFIQNKNEGSIYVSSPEFSKIKFVDIPLDPNNPYISLVDSPGDGKISFHKSGIVSIRNYEDTKSRKLIIEGNYLLNLEKSIAGLRHLFTIFLSKPMDLPQSPAHNRKSDYVITSSEELSPCVMIFFAIPRTEELRSVQFTSSMHMDNFKDLPKGMGVIELPYHLIGWYTYNTTYMANWPNSPLVCYRDGYTVPAFLGSEKGLAIKLCETDYKLIEGEVNINISFTGADT
jgi:hypothetical protein